MTILESNTDQYPEFDRYAPSYAELLKDPMRSRFSDDPLHFHRRKVLLIERLLRRIGAVSETLRWLDVGCGQGELLELGGRNFAQAMGCDPSSGMLSSTGSFRMYEQPSQVELPFADGSVDFVTAVCVYHHVHGDARTLLTREIRRVLSSRGLCCIIEHNPWNPVTRAIVKRSPVDVDAELLAARETGELLKASGFEVVSTDYFLYLPERLYGKLGATEQAFAMIPFGGQYALLGRARL